MRSSILKGFSLIELLIAISVISLLITIGALTYQDIQKKGRDAKRQSDLRVIQGALEQYFADNKRYPYNLPAGLTGAEECYGVVYGDGLATEICSPPGRAYLKNYPQETLNPTTWGYQYKYIMDPANTFAVSYCLYAHLEVVPTDTCPSQCLLIPNNLNYCIIPP